MASQKVSLTQKYLPKDVWNWLSKKTSYGTTIYDCVVSGMCVRERERDFAIKILLIINKLLKIQTATVVYTPQIQRLMMFLLNYFIQ